MAASFLDVWREFHGKGADPYEFAHAALLMAEMVVSHYETPEENVAFGKYLQKAGARKISIFGGDNSTDA